MNDLILAANSNKTPLDILDDAELVRITKARAGEEEVEVDLSDL